jgi:ABC-type Na+ transport system ATPase subunit NatA
MQGTIGLGQHAAGGRTSFATGEKCRHPACVSKSRPLDESVLAGKGYCRRTAAILYITHRLETIAGFADRVAVMKDGAIREMGDIAAVMQHPQADYTKALLQAADYR